ncbi:FecR domain-containing protein [Chitinophaga sp.]|uniref:FecR family protein n=1 Tax=Chitinophaga sp. TaxID=1869181 RepID=UPI0031D32A32
MEEINQLIAKFWAGTATEAEKNYLFQYLDSHEEAWQEYLRQGYEQKSFIQDAPLSETVSAAILQNLHNGIGTKVIPMRAWLKWAVAAMLILFAGGSVLYFNHSGNRKLADNTPGMIQHRNGGMSTEIFNLPDGSQVKLQPGSTISYAPQFTPGERNILLDGAAFFHATHDDKRPFSVTAKAFKTTALGTSFYINTATDSISVKLIEGKVVIRAIKESSMVMRDIYLTPGQEFVASTTQKRCRVQDFSEVAATPAKQEHITIMAFNKTNLTSVFRQLGAHYHLQIDLDSTVVSGLTFTGVFEQSDAPQVVLAAICTMNDLSWKQEGSRIVISKIK